MKLLEDRILVKEILKTNITKAGLFIPEDSIEETLPRVEVIEKSEKVTDVNIGDVLLIGKYSGTEVSLNFQNHKVIRVGDIILIE